MPYDNVKGKCSIAARSSFCASPPILAHINNSIYLFQFTEEKLGQAEKTELDAHFENLLQRADKTRDWTDKMLKQTEAVLQPNPSKINTSAI